MFGTRVVWMFRTPVILCFEHPVFFRSEHLDGFCSEHPEKRFYVLYLVPNLRLLNRVFGRVRTKKDPPEQISICQKKNCKSGLKRSNFVYNIIITIKDMN